MKYDKQSIIKRTNRINIFKKIAKEIIYILLIILIYNIFLIATSSLNKTEAKEIFGYKAYIISSNSMFPNIKNGDTIIVKEVEQEKLKVGDVISFQREEEIITHRIIEVIGLNEKKEYITKGDNNNIQDDNTIKYEDIEGLAILRIPLLGKIIILLENKIYLIFLILIVIILLVHTKRVQEKKEKRREQKKIEDRKIKDQSNSN